MLQETCRAGLQLAAVKSISHIYYHSRDSNSKMREGGGKPACTQSAWMSDTLKSSSVWVFSSKHRMHEDIWETKWLMCHTTSFFSIRTQWTFTPHSEHCANSTAAYHSSTQLLSLREREHTTIAKAYKLKHMQAHKQSRYFGRLLHINISIFMTRVWLDFWWGSVVSNIALASLTGCTQWMHIDCIAPGQLT